MNGSMNKWSYHVTQDKKGGQNPGIQRQKIRAQRRSGKQETNWMVQPPRSKKERELLKGESITCSREVVPRDLRKYHWIWTSRSSLSPPWLSPSSVEVGVRWAQCRENLCTSFLLRGTHPLTEEPREALVRKATVLQLHSQPSLPNSWA